MAACDRLVGGRAMPLCCVVVAACHCLHQWRLLDCGRCQDYRALAKLVASRAQPPCAHAVLRADRLATRQQAVVASRQP